MTLIRATEQEADYGLVTSVTKAFNGMEVIIREDGSDFEIGFPVYFDLYSNIPLDRDPVIQVGDSIRIIGFEDDGIIRNLSVNGVEWFDYTKKEAEIISQIRRRRREISILSDELNGPDINQ